MFVKLSICLSIGVLNASSIVEGFEPDTPQQNSYGVSDPIPIPTNNRSSRTNKDQEFVVGSPYSYEKSPIRKRLEALERSQSKEADE